MKRTIVVCPQAGLGNRMRVISSFIHMKERVGADLQVLWLPDAGLNAELYDIFKENPHFRVIENKKRFQPLLIRRGLLNHSNPLLRKTSRAYNHLIKGAVKVDGFIEQDDMAKGYRFVEDKIKIHNTVFVNTSNEIIDYPEGLQTFEPSTQVEDRMKETLAKFDQSTIGFHIRRTDHKIAIKNSPVALFVDKMEYYLSLSEETKFFLATDDLKVEEELKSKFRDKCITHKKVFGRNSKAGIIDAAAEMYLLSNTKKIYGSYWSSFSIIAAKLSGIEYEILQVGKPEITI